MPQHVRDTVVELIGKKKNGIISGGTGSGKTTLMKAFLDHIPETERLLIIEQPAELKVAHKNAVRWEAVEEIPGQVAITPSELSSGSSPPSPRPDHHGRNPKRMRLRLASGDEHRPRRNTVYDPRKVGMGRPESSLSNLALSARPNLNHAFMRSETAEAIDFVLYCERDPTGRRRVRELITVGRLQPCRTELPDRGGLPRLRSLTASPNAREPNPYPRSYRCTIMLPFRRQSPNCL